MEIVKQKLEEEKEKVKTLEETIKKRNTIIDALESKIRKNKLIKGLK